MKIKVIDLLNKIANEEEVPKQIKYDNDIYTYNNQYQDYELFGRYGHSWLLNTLFDDYSRTKETLDCELEIIKEDKEIEESIKRLGEKLNKTFKLMVESKKYYYPKIHEDLLEKEDKEIEYINGDYWNHEKYQSKQRINVCMNKINELIEEINELKKGK